MPANLAVAGCTYYKLSGGPDEARRFLVVPDDLRPLVHVVKHTTKARSAG